MASQYRHTYSHVTSNSLHERRHPTTHADLTLMHEIAQPLTAILVDAEAALRVVDKRAAVRGILNDILASAIRAVDILNMSRTMLHGGEQRIESRRLSQIVTDALRFTAVNLDAVGVSVELHFDADSDVVDVDHAQIAQVIVNLVTNACHAMSSTPRRERVLRIATRADAQHIFLTMADSGVGVPPDARERIFQPFVTSKPTGLGLGLAISRGIVNAHGGQLRAEAVERGALFSMQLPRAPRASHARQLDEGPIEAEKPDREASRP
jgi:two-component system sensor kinase FixL